MSACVLVNAALNGNAQVHKAITRAYDYIDKSQISEDVPHRDTYFRHISKGGWPFSTQDHGQCTFSTNINVGIVCLLLAVVCAAA
jgi:hypothetical protein